jgi:transcription elongation factor Elf1
MSNMNTNGRSLRDQFQQQQQKHDIQFECIHCGRHQTISLLSQSKIIKGVCCLYIYRRLKICVQVLRAGASRNMNQCPCPQNLFTFL